MQDSIPVRVVGLAVVSITHAVAVPVFDQPLQSLQPNQLLELTLEPVNGSPLNRSTGPIQLIGRVVKVLRPRSGRLETTEVKNRVQA